MCPYGKLTQALALFWGAGSTTVSGCLRSSIYRCSQATCLSGTDCRHQMALINRQFNGTKEPFYRIIEIVWLFREID